MNAGQGFKNSAKALGSNAFTAIATMHWQAKAHRTATSFVGGTDYFRPTYRFCCCCGDKRKLWSAFCRPPEHPRWREHCRKAIKSISARNLNIYWQTSGSRTCLDHPKLGYLQKISMSTIVRTGDLVGTVDVDRSALKAGDIVVFDWHDRRFFHRYIGNSRIKGDSNQTMDAVQINQLKAIARVEFVYRGAQVIYHRRRFRLADVLISQISWAGGKVVGVFGKHTYFPFRNLIIAVNHFHRCLQLLTFRDSNAHLPKL